MTAPGEDASERDRRRHRAYVASVVAGSGSLLSSATAVGFSFTSWAVADLAVPLGFWIGLMAGVGGLVASRYGASKVAARLSVAALVVWFGILVAAFQAAAP